ncbi:MAG: HPr family phosphocarrier protein [Selenomonadaceae bacterium]|nr:HPr family phosphocarrier protein [Selenomonadaceae bacterium]
MTMKIAYRASKNKSRKTVAKAEPKTQATHNEVSFILVSKGIIGFRESARLIKIAEETNCTMTIASGKKLGTTKSILSLVNLEIMPGKSLVLNIKGERNEEAFREASKVISGETDSNI